MVCAGMAQHQHQEKRRGSNTCLVCGRQGGNTIVVTSVHSFVSASGTPLADFLVKVSGDLIWYQLHIPIELTLMLWKRIFVNFSPCLLLDA